jgi:YHS domain-containing protein
MKKAVMTLIVAGGLSLAGFAMADQGKPTDAANPTSVPATTQAVKDVANKMCPVMPDEEVSKKYFVEYKGEKIHLCCKDCMKDFKKDPDKYVKAAHADAAKNAKNAKKTS